MKAIDLIRVLVTNRYQKHFTMPHYTPLNWFECDVFEITDAGYFREYEVKLTRADFFADSKKEKRRTVRDKTAEYGWRDEIRNKHQCLADGYPFGPVQFWYVTPEGLLKPEEVPAWAGLIEVHDRGESWKSRRFYEWPVKEPKRLHGAKLEDGIKTHAEGVCYWRFHKILLKERH